MKAALASGLIQRIPFRTTPPRAITAPVAYEDAARDPDTGLSDNRDRYIAQSAATRCGRAAPLPPPRTSAP